MKLGITGLPGSGKTTVFEALGRNLGGPGHKGENRIGAVHVPDERVDVLSGMFNPKKTTYAQVEYFLPGISQDKDKSAWNLVRDCDALIHVIRNFGGYGFEKPDPYADFRKLDQEFVLADLVVVEKRLERIDMDKKRGKPIDNEELSLLNECHAKLEQEIPLRKFPELASAPQFRGFAFLSGKPMLALYNNEDDDENLPKGHEDFEEEQMVIRGKLEQELAQMSEEEAADFLSEFNISSSAMDRVIIKSYELLGIISFLTIGTDEVRAWPIKKGTVAVDAAGTVHSDMKQGFIRAEVVSYADFMDAGSLAEARKRGTVRLEGKTYEVCDGDIINFRFNV